MSTAVKRACDACHRRKVKCDGINPCRNCSSAQLTCTYNAIPQKKGPKGSRAKVISELRETQRATSLSAKVQSRLNGMPSPPCTPSLAPNTGLLSSELIKDSIDFFFANMYPIMPVLNRHRLEQQVMYIDQSLDSYCLLTSLCAFVLLQPGMTMPGNDPLFELPGANITSSNLLLEEALRVRKGYDYTANPSLSTLCTSYFIYGCYYSFEIHEKAWYHLREATTLAHISGMTQEEKYVNPNIDTIESSRLRRLYWLIFVAERSYALKYNRPLSLPANINPPALTDDPTDPLAHHIHGFIRLVNLYRPLDDTLMLLWNKARSEFPTYHLSALQKQASEIQHSPYMNGVDAHDMRTNQQWLKMVHWNMTTGCVPSGDDMACQYPMDMSQDVAGLNRQFTQSGPLFGVSLVAKLLEMACGMADVLSMQPSSGDPFTMAPQQHLQALLQLVTILRSGHHHFLPLLLNKVHEMLSRLANPMLQRVPDNLCNLDIFDGFGNAGMAQPPVLTDYKVEQFKAEPYTPQSQQPMSRMDDMATDSGSPSNGAAPADMGNSPFPNMNVSSPQVVSPGMDYEHNGHQQQSHLGEFNPMSNLVMNSMGQPSNSQPPQHAQQQQPPPPPPQQQQQQQQQQPPPPQLPGFQAPQGLAQSTHSMHAGQMQNANSIHGQMNHGLNQNSMGHPPTSGPPSASGHTQPYNHMMMSNLLNRQPPARQNSFSMHPQGPSQIRTVGDFHALQRNNSDNVSTISSLSMNQLPTEMDFSGGLR